MNEIIGPSLTLSLLLLACGHIEEQPIGDITAGGSGAGGSAQSQAGSGGSVSGTSGSSSGGGSTAARCGGEVCAAGSDCFVAKGATSADGVCVPLCNPADPVDQTSWGLPCSGAVAGGEGVCRPFLRYVDLGGAIGAGLIGVGVCTDACDPLAQDCPGGFSCTLTDTPDGSLAVWSYACMPVLRHLEIGAACEGMPVGDCAPGAMCAEDYACRAFCDSLATDPCPAVQACEIPTWFPSGSSVGVCVDP